MRSQGCRWARRVDDGGRMRGVVRAGVSVALVVMIGVLASCKGNGGNANANAGAKGTSGVGYVDAYHRGNYAAAKTSAVSAYNSSTGSAREQAGLIAGLSAQSLGQKPEAKRYLRPLLASQDPEIAGRAGAGLGLIAREEGDKSGAARILAEAAPKLKGDEAAKAAMFAGDAYKSLGKDAEATAQYAVAAKNVTSQSLRAQIQDRQAGKKFAVQAGAFGTKANAEKRVKEVLPKSTAFGFGTPRIVASTSAGKSVYLVYIGEFGLRQDATEAMMKMKVPEGRVAEVE